MLWNSHGRYDGFGLEYRSVAKGAATVSRQIQLIPLIEE